MKINNEFELPLPLNEAWPLLLDVPAIAPCVPGAELTEILGDSSYRGRASIKVGPLLLDFAGEAQLTEIDPTKTRVVIETDLNLAGSIAQYGRASGLLKQIAQEVINQFAGNLSMLRPHGSAGGQANLGDPMDDGLAQPVRAVSGISLLWRAFKAWTERFVRLPACADRSWRR